MATVAPATTAPLASKIVPRSEVTSDCGKRNLLNVKTNTSKKANNREADCMGSPSRSRNSAVAGTRGTFSATEKIRWNIAGYFAIADPTMQAQECFDRAGDPRLIREQSLIAKCTD